MWVNYSLPKKPETSYAKHMLEILGDWLDDDREIKNTALLARTLDRCELTGRCG